MARSRAIMHEEYNPQRMDLRVTFENGKEYIYTPVSQDFYEMFTAARSEGKFFNDFIKHNPALTCLKVVE